MKKFFKYALIGLGIFIVIAVIGTALSNPDAMKESAEKGFNDGKKAVEQTKPQVDERKVYEYTTTLYRAYEQQAFDKNDANPSLSADEKSENLTVAEEKALNETADKYGITVDQVKEIIDKGQKENW